MYIRAQKTIDNQIPSWSTGTDAEIAQALQDHYAGKIDLTQYWSVGDERVVSLSAMEATGVGESHVAQDVTFVILHGKDMFDLTEAGYSGKKNAFVVGMKGVLNNNGTPENGYIDTQNKVISGYNWKNFARRTWCDSVFREAIPSTVKGWFKKFQYKSITNNGTNGGDPITNYTIDTLENYFTLPAINEVFNDEYGARWSSNQYDFIYLLEGSMMDYYLIGANKMKGLTEAHCWLRTPRADSNYYFDDIWARSTYAQTGMSQRPNSSCSISPFGCI